MLIFQQRFIRKLLDNLDGITKVCNPRFVISTVGRNLNDIIVFAYTRFFALLEMTWFFDCFNGIRLEHTEDIPA